VRRHRVKIAEVMVTKGGMRIRFEPTALLHACASQGWSLAQLAREAHVSRPTVSGAARGLVVTPRTAFRIRQAFLRASGGATSRGEDGPLVPKGPGT
jgi:predicted transcriptional regulator